MPFVDWAIIGAYLAGVLTIGLIVARRARASDDLVLAGRRIPAWAAAISVLATSLSGVTFLGGPQLAYSGDISYLSTNIGMIVGGVIVALVFVPAFYRMGVRSVYGVLEQRAGPVATRAASLAFLGGRVLASGSRLYVAAIPAAVLVFGDLSVRSTVLAVLLIAAIATTYTVCGGLAAVIWTDLVQAVLLIGAALVAVALLLWKIPIGTHAIVEILRTTESAPGVMKSTLIDTSLALDRSFTLPAVLIGFTLMGVGAYGTDQDLAQRTIACRDAKRGAISLLGGVTLGVFAAAVFLVLGLLLYVFYQRPDAMGTAAPAPPPEDTRRIFLYFIRTQVPAGVRGLMLSGLFAAAMSSLDSALNAMAGATMTDVLPRRERTPEQERRLVRPLVVIWACVLAAFACGCAIVGAGESDGLIPFALGVMAFAYAGLIGVFASFILLRRGNAASVIAALVVGAGTVGAIRFLWNPLDHRVDLAFPWQLTLGTLLSFVTCALAPHPPDAA